eukprot:scaffold30753_cov57-Attheya_sp.AAC.1
MIAPHLPGRSPGSVGNRWRKISQETNPDLILTDMASRHTSKRVAMSPLMTKQRADKEDSTIGNLQSQLGSSRFTCPTADIVKQRNRKEIKRGSVARHQLKTRTRKEIDTVKKHRIKERQSFKRRPQSTVADPNSNSPYPPRVPMCMLDRSQSDIDVMNRGDTWTDNFIRPAVREKSGSEGALRATSTETKDSSLNQLTHSHIHKDESLDDRTRIFEEEDMKKMRFEVLDQFMETMDHDHANTMACLSDPEKRKRCLQSYHERALSEHLTDETKFRSDD